MKVALVVHQVTGDIDSNLERIRQAVNEASGYGVDLVLFAEASLTGLINNDDPSHDIPLGMPIPGRITDIIGGLCIKNKIWLGIGLLEFEDNRLFDSALLFDIEGDIKLKYRRISTGWHGNKADPQIYCQGEILDKVNTPFGSVSFLICGDLFDDNLIEQIRQISPDWILFPFARCFDDDTNAQKRWDNEEKMIYLERVRQIGIPTLMTNYVSFENDEGKAFGGAMAVRFDGTVLGSFPLQQSGILYIDLSNSILTE